MNKLNYRLIMNWMFLIFFSFIFGCSSPSRENAMEETRKEDILNENSPRANLNAKPDQVNFYLENSGSMTGYFQGHQEIKQAIAQLIYGIKTFNQDISLNFVNSQIYPYHQSADNFINDLDPEGIKVGDISKSDINNIFQMVLDSTNNGAISILVTDAIYSVDGSRRDNVGALKTSKYKTKSIFTSKIQSQNLNTIVIQMSSGFEGFYYPAEGKPVEIEQNRPYYIFIFGNQQLLKYFNREINTSSLAGFQNLTQFSLVDQYDVFYSVTPLYMKGKYREAKKSNAFDKVTQINYIQDSDRPDTKGKFGFSVAFNFSPIPEDPAYFLDLTNYEYPENYTLSISPVNELERTERQRLKNKFQGHDLTHLAILETESNPIGVFELKLLKQLPYWITSAHIEDDTHIEGDERHTFGIQYLIEGISEAYDDVSTQDSYCDVNIDINL